MLGNEKYEIEGRIFENSINEWSIKYCSAMTLEQKCFLMALISKNKIKNVLEIGVFNGVSSLCMLKAGLMNNNDFQLYSIDINNDSSFIGQAAKETCSIEELEHFNLYIGKSIVDIEYIIDKEIKFDLVVIDAGHAHPFPLFDLIYSIPYMHHNTFIILHDIIDYMRPNAWGGKFYI